MNKIIKTTNDKNIIFQLKFLVGMYVTIYYNDISP